jgi:hypothetical protein
VNRVIEFEKRVIFISNMKYEKLADNYMVINKKSIQNIDSPTGHHGLSS